MLGTSATTTLDHDWGLTDPLRSACLEAVLSWPSHPASVFVDPAMSAPLEGATCSAIWLVRVQAWGNGGGSDWSEPAIVVSTEALGRVTATHGAGVSSDAATRRSQHVLQRHLLEGVWGPGTSGAVGGGQTRNFPPHQGGFDDVDDDAEADYDAEDDRIVSSTKASGHNDRQGRADEGDSSGIETRRISSAPAMLTRSSQVELVTAQSIRKLDSTAMEVVVADGALSIVPLAGLQDPLGALEELSRQQTKTLAQAIAELGQHVESSTRQASAEQSEATKLGLEQLQAVIEAGMASAASAAASMAASMVAASLEEHGPRADPPVRAAQPAAPQEASSSLSSSSWRREAIERIVLSATMLVSIATTLFYCFSVASQPLAAPEPAAVGRRPDGVITSIDDGTGEPFLVLGGDHVPPQAEAAKPAASPKSSLHISGFVSWFASSRPTARGVGSPPAAARRRDTGRPQHQSTSPSFLRSRGILYGERRPRAAHFAEAEHPSSFLAVAESHAETSLALADGPAAVSSSAHRRVIGGGFGDGAGPATPRRAQPSSEATAAKASRSHATPHGQWPEFYAQEAMPTAQVNRMQRAVVRAMADTAETTFERAAPDRCFICDGKFRLRSIREYRARHSCKQCARSFCGKCGHIGHLPLLPCGNQCLCDACLHHNAAFAVDGEGVAARLNLDQLPRHLH
jgi:hypothetical protein